MKRELHLRLFALCAIFLAAMMLGCEEEAKKQPAPKEKAKAKAEPKEAPSALQGAGKMVAGAGKMVVEGTGKVVTGSGKMIYEAGKAVVQGGGMLASGAGEVITSIGVVISKAVGDVMEVTFAPETKAIDFALRDIDGREVRLSDHLGHPVVLLFCSTNYPPCVVEMQHLRNLQEKYAEDGLRVIAIAMDWEGPAALRNFRRELELNYPLLWDNGTVFKKYTSMMKVPTTFLIDRKGNIWKKRVGFRSATIITQGGQFAGSSVVEMEKGFEEDIVALINKK